MPTNKEHIEKGRTMKLTQEEIDQYIEYIKNTRQVYDELEWLIRNHIDNEGLESIKNVIDDLNG